MKQQHSEASLNPSKLCRLLFLVFTLKVTVIGVMLFDPMLSGVLELFADPSQKAQQVTAISGVAHAADAAGAPPALAPSVATGNQAPAAVTQQQAPSTTTSLPPSTRALPPIGPKSTPTTNGAGNGTKAANGGAESDLTKDMLARKQEEMARKEQELRTLETQLNDKLHRMELLENRLAVMMKEAEGANDAKFRHLVDVLSNMKAKSAAQVLETLDSRIAVKVLAGMRGRQAGEILTFVKPEIAASLTSALTRMQMPME